MSPVMLIGAANIGFKGLGRTFEFSKQNLPPVKIAAVVDQMSAGVIDSVARVQLDLDENEAESMLMSESKHARRLAEGESPFCTAAGPFYDKYLAEYGAPLHTCLCDSDVFSHFDTKSGYPPSMGAEAVALTMAMCACKGEFSAKFPAEAESMDVCTLADACPKVDLVAMTTGDFSTQRGLCASSTCTKALSDIFDEDTSKTCSWIESCPGLDLDALSAGVLDANAIDVLCKKPNEHVWPPPCLTAFIHSSGCQGGCADGMLSLCPLLGECTSAELAGGMASASEGLCPADGSKVSRKCAAAVAKSSSCNAACEANMVGCVKQENDHAFNADKHHVQPPKVPATIS